MTLEVYPPGDTVTNRVAVNHTLGNRKDGNSTSDTNGGDRQVNSDNSKNNKNKTKDNKGHDLIDLSYQDDSTVPPPPYVSMADSATYNELPPANDHNDNDGDGTSRSSITNLIGMLLHAILSKIHTYPHMALILSTLFTISLFHLTVSNTMDMVSRVSIYIAALILFELGFTFPFTTAQGRDSNGGGSGSSYADLVGRGLIALSAAVLACGHLLFFLKNVDFDGNTRTFILLWLVVTTFLTGGIFICVNQPRPMRHHA